MRQWQQQSVSVSVRPPAQSDWFPFPFWFYDCVLFFFVICLSFSMFYLNIFEMDMIEDTNQHKNFCPKFLFDTYRHIFCRSFLSRSLVLFPCFVWLISCFYLIENRNECVAKRSNERKKLLSCCMCVAGSFHLSMAAIRWQPYHFDRMLLVMYLFFPFQTMCINQFSMNICFHICPNYTGSVDLFIYT